MSWKKLSKSALFYGVLYLLFIPIFAAIYWLVPTVNGSFVGSNLSLSQSIYFSAVTITTLGFGDIHPKESESLAQMTVALEAVLGLVTIGLFLNAAATSSYNARRAALEERVYQLLNWITFYQLFVIQHATLSRISQSEIKNSELSEAKIRECMKGVFYRSPIPSSSNTVGPAMANNLTTIRDYTNELLKHVEYLDPELIKIVSEFNNNEPLGQWLRCFDAKPLVTPFGTIDYHASDISSYSKEFHEIHKTSLALRRYQEKKFRHRPETIYAMLENAVNHEHDFTRALKLAKSLYKYEEHSKNAHFLTIVASLGIEDYALAKRALRNYTSIGPEDSRFVIEQIVRYHKQIPPERLKHLL